MMADSVSTGALALRILIPVVIGVAMIMAGINQSRARRKRMFEMQDLSTRLGFDDFSPNRDDEFAIGWGFVNLFAQGQERYAFNLLRGTYHEQSLFVFDYHYQTGSGKNKKEHDLTMLMLIFKEAFPLVSIQPGGENLLDKMAEAFGIGDDIKFESAEFSRKFRVCSPDKKFAYDACNPQMIDYLLSNPGLHVEIQGPVLLLAFEPQLPVARIEFNLQRLIEIRSLLPEYLFTNK